MATQQCGAHTALTSFLDRSALHGVLAEIEALGPGMLLGWRTLALRQRR
jgi:hypothetical protein